MNKFSSAIKVTTFLFIGSGLGLSIVQAQTPELDNHINAIKNIFQQLDAAAEACLDASDDQSCLVFASAIDGESLGQYLQHCEVLRGWREQLVASNAGNGDSAELAPETAQHLIEVEFTCGENALVTRTEFVLAAFQKIQSASAGQLPVLQSLSSQQQTASAYERYRRSLLDSVNRQQIRLGNETRQLWHNIELETLREQNRRPIDIGNIIQ